MDKDRNMSDEPIKQTYMPWEEGISTKPSVDALLREFPPETITPGWEVSDEVVHEIVNAPTESHHKSVIRAWRNRLLRDHGVIIYRLKVTGFRCPYTKEVQSETHSVLKKTGRAIGKQLTHVARAKPTNELEKSVQDHQGRLLHAQKRELRKARMNTLPSGQPTPMPRISPPPRAEATQ